MTETSIWTLHKNIEEKDSGHDYDPRFKAVLEAALTQTMDFDEISRILAPIFTELLFASLTHDQEAFKALIQAGIAAHDRLIGR